MIKAFCDAGDVGTAYAWFERLSTTDGEVVLSFCYDTFQLITVSISDAYTPNIFAWAHIITALGVSGRVREMNALVASLIGEVSPSGFKLRHTQVKVIVDANVVTV